MDHPRLFLGLRIAVSAVCVIVCALLIVLWGRSYWWFDNLYTPLTKSIEVDISSVRGLLQWHRTHGNSSNSRSNSELVSESVEELQALGLPPVTLQSHFFFRLIGDPVVPHWFLILLFATLAAIPWVRWKFSLSLLLIAATLIAVGLGLVVLFGR